MGVVNYSSFAKIVYEHMIKKDMTALANSFFSFLIDEPNYIPNDNGDIFTINSRLAREWFRCETNISPTLRGAAAKQKIIDMAPNYIGTAIEKLIYEDQQDVMYKEFSGSIGVGDIVDFSNVGGYSIVDKPPFIHPDIPIYMDREGERSLIKRAQTIDDIFAPYIF